jgi:EamA-like transporter family
VLGLALAGTLAGFWLFAWAQVRVPAQLASAFVNLEPLVGALSGVVAFHEAVGPAQALGGLGILAGIALSALLDGRSRRYGSRPRQRSDVTNAAISASRPAAAKPALISRRSSRVPICEPSRS